MGAVIAGWLAIDHPDFAKRTEFFVTGLKMPDEPLTIRQFLAAQGAEDQSGMDRRSIYASLVLVAVVFALILLQPFGLNEVGSMRRIAYWTFICLTGYCLYGAAFLLGGRILAAISLRLPYPLPIILIGSIASVLMSFAVIYSGYLFFDFRRGYLSQFLTVFPQALTIGALLLSVTIAIDYIGEQNRRLRAHRVVTSGHDQAVAAFLENLPVKLRGELLCIETEDHYLRVHTDRGQHLFLMRLRDATDRLVNARGLQVHRSWWVAESAVSDAVTEGRKISLVLKNGLTIPVSRKYASQVRARNLLK